MTTLQRYSSNSLTLIFTLSMSLYLSFLMTDSLQAATKTFVFCSESSPSQFNPQLATDGTSFTAGSRQIFNRLVEFKTGQTSVSPGLAESWTVSKDQLHYTFKLRKGVKFQTTDFFKPTRDFNADDVLFSFNRMRLKDHPFHAVSGGNYEYFDSMDLGKIIKDIKKIDPMTVEFVLNQPEAPFIADLAMDFASILSEEFASKLKAAGTPEKLDTMPVGTGPFILTKYTKDSQIRYQANSEYFRGAPKINTLVFSITPDASVRYQKLKAGECHLITEPSPVDLPLMKKDARLNVLNRAGLNIAYLAFQTEKAPFNQKKVREAIGLALNKKNYVDAIYLGQGEVAKNPIPPTMWSYDQSVQDQTYQVEKAKALLKEANFPFDQTFDLWTMPVSRPYNPNGKKMGELMQADLAKVGVKIKLVTYDWPTYLAKSKKEANYHMIQMGWSGDNGDPDNFLNVLLSCDSIKAGSNLAHWCNTAFDSLINQAKTTSQVSKRTDLYKKAQKLFRQELPWITIAHSTVHRAMLKSVKGYVIDAFGGDQFAEVDLQ